ncbi:hypothetical protein BV20DRAFT_960358 [Pilatotrama ljubarskyi]|nr:hypothetical protein BV20DRAFT_960358 [Pilatotrama ljubarskyi]
MSEQVARAHTSISNRAKARDDAERKVLFRSVVDNPFRVQWPSVPFNIQNAVLACVVDMLDGVAAYNVSRERLGRRKRRRSQSSADDNESNKAKKLSGAAVTQDARSAADHGIRTQATDVTDAMPVDGAIAIPPALNSLTVGINEVTKRLEALSISHRSSVAAGSDDAVQRGDASHRSRVVVACRADVDPPALIGHIPCLVAACNSRASTSSGTTWLVPLPKGAEHTLAEAVGLRRASILLVEASAPGFPALAALLVNIPRLTAPWLEPSTSIPAVPLIPTHVKQVRTTAPKDMKAAKEKRLRERSAAKERRRLSSVPKHVTITPKPRPS